jgi:VWFA-related protein
LDREYFKIYEDKVEMPITHFASDEVPMTVGLVFDSSGSMGPKLQKSRAAVAEFLKIANPEDEFSLVEFSDTARLAVPLTREFRDIQNRLMFTQSKGRTALLDGLYLALLEMKHAHNARKALLVISDGGDNSSRYTSKDLKNLVQESDVQIYSIGVFEPLARRSQTPEELSGPDLLGDVATASGGRLFEIQDVNELPGVASKIGMALRNEYVLGYSPTAEKRDGKYHRIQVKMARPKGVPPLRASFRSGYYAPAE